jgi:hypothetical protein
VLLALSPMLRATAISPRQQAALAAALLIGGQLLLGYWFYNYLAWCYPLLLVAIIHPRTERGPADRSACLLEDLDRVADVDHGTRARLVGDQVDAEPDLLVPAAMPRQGR